MLRMRVKWLHQLNISQSLLHHFILITKVKQTIPLRQIPNSQCRLLLLRLYSGTSYSRGTRSRWLTIQLRDDGVSGRVYDVLGLVDVEVLEFEELFDLSGDVLDKVMLELSQVQHSCFLLLRFDYLVIYNALLIRLEVQ